MSWRKFGYILSLMFSVFFMKSTALANGDSGVVKLDRVEVLPDGTARFFAKSGYAFNNPDNCDGTFMILLAESTSLSEYEFDRMLSVALTAAASNSHVRFWLAGCVQRGSSTVPSVYSISFLAN